jgi:hypothetical protein
MFVVMRASFLSFNFFSMKCLAPVASLHVDLGWDSVEWYLGNVFRKKLDSCHGRAVLSSGDGVRMDREPFILLLLLQVPIGPTFSDCWQLVELLAGLLEVSRRKLGDVPTDP